MEDIQVTGIIPFGYVTALIEIGCKDICVLINCPVLDGGHIVRLDFGNLPEATVQEIDLKIESPSRHILIKILQVRVFVNRFKKRMPTIMFG